MIVLKVLVIVLTFNNFTNALNYRKCLQSSLNSDFEFIILHNNDIHGRFDQTDAQGNACTNDLARKKQCYGGFARISYVLQAYRSLAKLPGGNPVIYLNAGDMYTGTIWFSIFKDKISSNLMNKLKPDAMTLGNHEFDKGIKGLVPFLKDIQSPVVVSNLDISETPELQAIKHLSKSTILHVGRSKIGIIGYLTPETIGTTSTGNVKLTPEIDAINQEAENLKRQGVNIIIALGHSGYNVDKEIAEHCPDVDIVVGGHTHSFLWSGCKNPKFTEIIEGPYPTGIRQPSGKIVPVVQAASFTKYLGYLKVKFDRNGKLIRWNGLPIMLDSKIPQSPEIVELVNTYRPEIDALGVEIGRTNLDLDGNRDNCRNGECVIGNLVADALVNCAQHKQNNNNHHHHHHNQHHHDHTRNICVGFMNAGALRKSLEKGGITLNDLMLTLPYNSSISIGNVTGNKILQNLEQSASYYQKDKGGFLQLSGLKVTFNMAMPIGNRVITALIKENCQSDQYTRLNMDKQYSVVMPKYILNGGDSYNWLDSNSNPHDLECTDFTALVDYVKSKSPIDYQIEGRQIHLLIQKQFTKKKFLNLILQFYFNQEN